MEKATEGDSHVLFLSPPSCAHCLLCGTFEFGLLERSCFYIHVPITECIHPGDLHSLSLYYVQGSVCAWGGGHVTLLETIGVLLAF